MSHKSAKDAMTSVSKIFSLDINSRLDEYVLHSVFPQIIHFQLVCYSYPSIWGSQKDNGTNSK